MISSRKLKVFLCHASQDKPIVRKLFRQLKSEGWVEPWLDEENLFPGMDWDFEIYKAIRASDAIILFCSTNSVSKEGYVQKEIKRALDMADEKPEGALYIIPLRLEACDVPVRISQWHWLDYFGNVAESYARLLTSLRLKGISLGALAPETINSLGQESIDGFQEKSDSIYANSLPFDEKRLKDIVTATISHKISVAQAILQNLAYFPYQEIVRYLKVENSDVSEQDQRDYLGGFYLVILIGLFGFLALEKDIFWAEAELSTRKLTETYKLLIKKYLRKAATLIQEDITAQKLMLKLQYDLLISKNRLENKGISLAVDTFLSYYSAYVKLKKTD